MDWRPYQRASLDGLESAYENHRSAIVVLPTGCGKTAVIAGAIQERSKKRALVLAHREELVFQAAQEIESVIGVRCGIEMANLRADDTTLFGQEVPRVVVGSVQSLCRESRLRNFNPDDFDLVVTDECHHDVPSNSTYHAIRRYFARSKCVRFLGVTATPDRADYLALGQNYETVAYQYPLTDAISESWLVPIRQRFVVINGLDFSGVRTTAGDLNQGDLEKILADEPEVVHGVASSIVQIADNRQTLIFAVSVHHAKLIAEVIRRHGKTAEVLHGETPSDQRRAVLSEYELCKVQYLVGCAIFTEGFNSPGIQVVAVARPTKSRALYTQMVGRGTRTLRGTLQSGMDSDARKLSISASDKPFLEVIDFVGNSGRHQLVTTAEILAGKCKSAAVSKAKERLQASGGSLDMMAAIQDEERAIDELERRAAEERKRLEEERKRAVKAKASYAARDVDPFGGCRGQGNDQHGYSKSEPVTEKQRKFLERHGVDTQDMNKQEANRKIGELMEGFKGKSCTQKQQETLAKFGEFGKITREKAVVLFAVLKSRFWQPRDFPLTRDRLKIAKNDDGYFSPVIVDPAGNRIVVAESRFTSVDGCREFLEQVVESAESVVVS